MTLQTDSAAKAAKLFIQSSPSIKDCLRRGLINYSALAREVCRRSGIKNTNAALMGIVRYAARIKKQVSSEANLRTEVQNAKLLVRSKMLVAAVDRGKDLQRLVALQEQIRSQNEDLTVIVGHAVITIITGEQSEHQIRSIFRGALRHLITNIAQIMLLVGSRAIFTPGVSAFVLAQLASQGVNVIEEVTCSGEHLILVDQRDLATALKALQFN